MALNRPRRTLHSTVELHNRNPMLIGAIVALAVLVYLVYTLLRPEKF